MKKISSRSKLQIQILFLDPTIRRNLIDESKKELYSRVSINEDGSITFGKTGCLWWNRLVGDEKTISFADFAIKTVAALAGQERNINDVILKGLSEEVIRNAVMREDYDTVVDRLFDAARYGVKGPLNTTGFSVSDKIDKHIKIESKDGIKIARLPGSGDPLCEIRVGVKGVDFYEQSICRLNRRLVTSLIDYYIFHLKLGQVNIPTSLPLWRNWQTRQT